MRWLWHTYGVCYGHISQSAWRIGGEGLVAHLLSNRCLLHMVAKLSTLILNEAAKLKILSGKIQTAHVPLGYKLNQLRSKTLFYLTKSESIDQTDACRFRVQSVVLQKERDHNVMLTSQPVINHPFYWWLAYLLVPPLSDSPTEATWFHTWKTR